MLKSFSWSPIRKLILDSTAKEITEKALEIANNSGRKKLTTEDIKIAMRLI